MVNCGVNRRFIFDEDSFTQLEAAGVSWWETNGALHGTGHKISRPIGAEGRNVVSRVPGNGWLSMGFTETTTDEVWLLTGVRRLSLDESTKLDQQFKEGSS